MPSSSRIVFAEDLAGAAPWRPEAIVGARRPGPDPRAPAGAVAPAAPAPTYEDGLRVGLARGRAQAQAELDAQRRAERDEQARRADALLASLATGVADAQQRFAGELVDLATEIARSAFGAALRIRADAALPAVSAALAAIADAHGRPVVHLHADDAARLGDALAPLLAARDARLVVDDTVAPGGCRIETPRVSVDATVRTRWRRALAALGRDDDWIDA